MLNSQHSISMLCILVFLLLGSSESLTTYATFTATKLPGIYNLGNLNPGDTVKIDVTYYEGVLLAPPTIVKWSNGSPTSVSLNPGDFTYSGNSYHL